MMLKPLWTRIVLLGSSSMTASCAASLPLSADPPRLTLPPVAETPCVLERLSGTQTQADLEVAYIQRGARLVECETARALAVETLIAERALQDRWRNEGEPRFRSRFWPWRLP